LDVSDTKAFTQHNTQIKNIAGSCFFVRTEGKNNYLAVWKDSAN